MSQPQLEYGSKARASSRADRLSRYLRRRWPILIIPFVVVASLGIGVWRFVGLKVDEPVGYSPALVVQEYTDVPAPPGATNIKTAGYSKGPIWSRYLRFQAPTNVCLAYARRLAGTEALTPAQPTDLDALLQHDSRTSRT